MTYKIGDIVPITIEDQDVAGAERYNSRRCPGAYAAKRQGFHYPEIRSEYVQFTDRKAGVRLRFYPNLEFVEAIQVWDAKGKWLRRRTWEFKIAFIIPVKHGPKDSATAAKYQKKAALRKQELAKLTPQQKAARTKRRTNLQKKARS